MKKDKEDAARLPEKYGQSPHIRPAGTVLWFHALSVGESLALIPLIDRALSQDSAAHVVLTTSTRTSIAALDKAELPGRAYHVMLPIDTAQAVRRFLDHWQPAVAVFAELDFWPRLMIDTHRRAIPMVLVNSRMSAVSFASRQKLGGMMRDILALFDRLLVQDEKSFGRFKQLGADPDRITVAGALKSAARPLPANEQDVTDLREKITERPIWLAAATRDIEEPKMIAAHIKVTQAKPNALLIIAPRFLDSADAIEISAKEAFEHVARRSKGQSPNEQTQIYIADTIGEMGLWYRLSPISFVGHSLGPHGKPLGGKNPYEAMALDSVVIHGDATEDFRETYQALTAESAAVLVDDAEDLAQIVLRLFHPSERAPFVTAAKRVIKQRSGVLDVTWDSISEVLER